MAADHEPGYERRQSYACAGCESLRGEIAALRAEFDSHVAWAGRAERLTALEKRIEDQDRHHRELRMMDEQARELASARMDDRLSDMNELRQQLNNERGNFISRVEHEEFQRRVATLERWQSAQDATRMALSRVAAIFGAAAGALAGALGNFLMMRH